MTHVEFVDIGTFYAQSPPTHLPPSEAGYAAWYLPAGRAAQFYRAVASRNRSAAYAAVLAGFGDPTHRVWSWQSAVLPPGSGNVLAAFGGGVVWVKVGGGWTEAGPAAAADEFWPGVGAMSDVLSSL